MCKKSGNWVVLNLKKYSYVSRKSFSTIKRIIRNKKMKRTYDFDPTEYLILEDKKLIYIVISKSACTSIKTTIGKNYDIVSRTKKGLDIHLNPKWERIFGKLDKKYHEYFIFSFVRNPFTRIVSSYKDRVLTSESNGSFLSNYFIGYPFRILPNISFQHFVNIISRIPDFLADRHFKSQYYSIHKKKISTSFIGKIEHFGTDWKYIADKFDFNEIIDKKNTTNKSKDIYKEYYTYYDIISAKKVFKRYKKDILTYGYLEEYHRLINYLENK